MAEKILVVDDEPDMLRSTEFLLEDMGYEVVTLQDESLVHETAVEQEPALILQDLKMGRLNVAGLMAGLRSDPATAGIPVVFVSGRTDLARTARRHGAAGWLGKPFTEAELRTVVERAFDPGAARVSTEDIGKTRREIREVFHDERSLFASITNYVALLKKNSQLTGRERELIEGVESAALKLEALQDRLRSYLLTLLREDEDFTAGAEPTADLAG